MPRLTALDIAGVHVLEIDRRGDARGWFARYCDVDELGERKLNGAFVQFNHSCTRRRGSIRGLHLQRGSAAEDKLVRCVRGGVLDVLVDVRVGSETFLQHVTVELSAERGNAVYVPRGVAHGFQTLEDDTELIYHHTNFYAPEQEWGIRYDDPRVGIVWPLPVAELSEKDRAWPLLAANFGGVHVA